MMTQKHRVLVIDDDLDICALIANKASDLGMECITTHDAAGFFESLTPDVTLIVLDLMMPNTDGIEILRSLGEYRCQAGIIVMSGIGKRVIQTAEEFASNLGLSTVGHLTKPFKLAQLEDILLRNPKRPSIQGPDEQLLIMFDRVDFCRAIEKGEFLLHYQPQIQVMTGHCVGLEALVRWQHPVHGLIVPDRFIGFAEESDLIDALTWTVLKKGLAEMGKMIDQGGSPLSLSFNISVLSLRDLAFPDTLVALLEDFDVSPERIILEITETGLICNLSQTLDVLARLRMKGIRLSIDDFGTGYSMMEQLRHIPANELKIDRSLLQNLHVDNYRVIVHKIIELAHELDVIAVAEGVETRLQLDFLRSKSCDVAQGYFFSTPLPKLEFIAWLDSYRDNLKNVLYERLLAS
jgi:EAL domain-containing protein (putative c-di-GMP-specific phosphodiesterase class I)/ActR/RegA family two-component response regulator